MQKLSIFFTLIFISNLYGAKIVFDLGGVMLSHVSIRAFPTIVYNIGWFHIINYCLHNGFNNPHPRIFEFADHVYQRKNACDLWLGGFITSEEFYNTLKNAIEDEENFSFFKNKSERRILKAGLIFLLPDKLNKVTYTYNQGIKTVQKCIDNGHEVYVLSNWDNQSFPKIEKKCTDCFNLFSKEKLYISGFIKKCKPGKEIFEYLIKDNDPSEYYFIDDNENNIDTAKKLGMHAIQHVNWESTNLKLTNLGVLKRKVKKSRVI